MTVDHLRRQAIAATLFRPTTLPRAVRRLGFVQADPIRAPARAQDLILRHRVAGYRAGDLERRYPTLDVEEDFLYAYGFLARPVWEDLHPRSAKNLTPTERRVLEIVTAHKRIHPRELEAYFGRKRQVNAWGGYAKATTHVLHALHHRGLLRVAGRENGIRLYEPPGPPHAPSPPSDRLRRLVLTIAALLAPVSDTSLRSTLQLFARGSPSLPGRRTIVADLLESGHLHTATVDQIRYLWPAGRVTRPEPADTVRFLAPFDPLVWDRRRFEHLWGWPYRFEAYVPPAQRRLGYYALPLLWRDAVVGWVNVSNPHGNLRVDPGFVGPTPTDPTFQRAFDAEAEQFRSFLVSR
jgi:uncharacterized protein YcaQ